MKSRSRDAGNSTPPYRYISESKISTLEDDTSSITQVAAAVLGTGFGFTVDRTRPIAARLNSVLDRLRKADLISAAGEKGKNYIEGAFRFAETSMMGVAIWVAVEGQTTLLLGGSTRYLQFHAGHQTEQAPGSNRSEILRGLTTLWRRGIDVNGQPIVSTQPVIEFDMAELWGAAASCKVCDNIAHSKETVEMPYNVRSYYRLATDVYSLFDDAFVDNLKFVAVVFTDYEFPPDFYDIECRGKRFIVGSPLYVSQAAPAGS